MITLTVLELALYVDQSVLEFRDLPASAAQVLEFNASSPTTLIYIHKFILILYVSMHT